MKSLAPLWKPAHLQIIAFKAWRISPLSDYMGYAVIKRNELQRGKS